MPIEDLFSAEDIVVAGQDGRRLPVERTGLAIIEAPRAVGVPDHQRRRLPRRTAFEMKLVKVREPLPEKHLQAAASREDLRSLLENRRQVSQPEAVTKPGDQFHLRGQQIDPLRRQRHVDHQLHPPAAGRRRHPGRVVEGTVFFQEDVDVGEGLVGRPIWFQHGGGTAERPPIVPGEEPRYRLEIITVGKVARSGWYRNILPVSG